MNKNQRQELMARISVSMNVDELHQECRATGRAYIGSEAALMQTFGVGAEDLKRALEEAGEEMGLYPVIGEMDEAHPGDYFFKMILYGAATKTGEVLRTNA